MAYDFAGRNPAYLAPGSLDAALAKADPFGLPTWIRGSAQLQVQDGDGDGTVPATSASAPGDRVAANVRLLGFDHQAAFSGSWSARTFTVLAICRLAGQISRPEEDSTS